MKKYCLAQFLVMCCCSPLLTTTTIDPTNTSVTTTKDLGEIFRLYGSDKDANGYTSVYHTLFDHLKDQPVTILEIGIGTMIPGAPSSMVGYSRPGYKPGGSLRAWRDYFPNGIIHGADIQSDTQFSDEPRIFTHICDSTDKSQVEAFMKSLGGIKFDIIIDDGSHVDTNQLKTLANFYPHLKTGGIYVIEDIYPGSTVSTHPNETAQLCNADPLFFVGLQNNVGIIYKKHLQRATTNYQF
jgi:hypothetical protein